MPDIRPLNDAAWSSNELRTEQMERLSAALSWWAEASSAQRSAYIARVTIATVAQIIAELPKLPDDVRAACRAAKTIDAARDASRAAARAASYTALSAANHALSAANYADTSDTANHAANAARYAGSAANAAGCAGDAVLILSVDVWVNAAKEEVEA